MRKIIMSEDEKLAPVAHSTFRKHAKTGKFSVSKNARGLQEVDVAELERYHGHLKNNGNGQFETQVGERNGQIETVERYEVER